MRAVIYMVDIQFIINVADSITHIRSTQIFCTYTYLRNNEVFANQQLINQCDYYLRLCNYTRNKYNTVRLPLYIQLNRVEWGTFAKKNGLFFKNICLNDGKIIIKLNILRKKFTLTNVLDYIVQKIAFNWVKLLLI